MSLGLAGPRAKSLAGLSRCSGMRLAPLGMEHRATLSAGMAVRFAATGAHREAASAAAIEAAARGLGAPWTSSRTGVRWASAEPASQRSSDGSAGVVSRPLLGFVLSASGALPLEDVFNAGGRFGRHASRSR
jgi:hypothetical protein